MKCDEYIDKLNFSRFIDYLERETKFVKNIFLTEFVLYDVDDAIGFRRTVAMLIEWQLIEADNLRINEKQRDLVNIILSAVAPFLCCYYQVTSTIIQEVSW